MKKSELAARLLKKNIHLLKCPVCGETMSVRESKSLTCINGHCFDIARSGYVNMLTKEVHTKYNTAMFTSRNILSKQGLFDPIIEKMYEIILNDSLVKSKNPLYILDAGCGEGSMVSNLLEKLTAGTQTPVLATGIDIAKEGVRIAARDNINCSWFVGDITDMPFESKIFDVILNIFSPSNYIEFNRLLKDDGILIKIIPGENHFSEIREWIFKGTGREEYSNRDVLKHFENNFNIVSNQNISYTVQMDSERMRHAIQMSPLSWSAGVDNFETYNIGTLNSLTIDLVIITGKRVEQRTPHE